MFGYEGELEVLEKRERQRSEHHHVEELELAVAHVRDLCAEQTNWKNQKQSRAEQTPEAQTRVLALSKAIMYSSRTILDDELSAIDMSEE